MKLSKSAVLLALGTPFLCAGVLGACGGDDNSGTNATDAGGVKDTGSSTLADTGSAFVNDSGSLVDAGSDAGDGGLKGLGQSCTADPDCTSKLCFMGGGGGGVNSAGDYCTIPCNMPVVNDPVCANKPGLTGKCNGKGACQPTVH